MLDLVRQIASFRNQVAELRARKNDLLVAWEAENKPLLDSLAELTIKTFAAEASLRAQAEQDYRESGNAEPVAGVLVKQFTTLSYDNQAALDWAIKHQIALMLDKKVFEKFAIATPPDFVLVQRIPKATIATDLDKALANPAPAGGKAA